MDAPVRDALVRPGRHPAWRQRLGSRFAEVEAVFDDCVDRALPRLSEQGLADWIDLASWLGRLGRGPEPLLAALECWPEVAALAGEEALIPLRHTLQQLQRSPNGRALAPLMHSLPAVARRLPSPEALQGYFDLVLQLAQATSLSVHGHHATEPSACLPAFLQAAPDLTALVPLEGLARWMRAGLRAHAHHPERQKAFFAGVSEDSRQLLQRERHGTLLMDAAPSLLHSLRALWGQSGTLVPLPVGADEPTPLSYLAQDGGDEALQWGYRLPEVLDATPTVSALDRYRARLGHLALHRQHSQPLVADNWSPLQRLAVECVEDARIDTLLLRHWPGFARSLRALHPCPPMPTTAPDRHSTLRVRLTRLSRALVFGVAQDELEAQALAQFQAAMADGAGDTATMARIALAWASRSRRASDQSAAVIFEDTVVDWRDDNRHLWRFIEAGDEEESFAERRSVPSDAAGLPPRRYPEWMSATQRLQADWVSVYDHLQPAADAGAIQALLQRHRGTARQVRQMIDRLKPQDRARERGQPEGTDLDLDAVVRSHVEARATGQAPDERVHSRTRHDGRRMAVLLLIDLSASVNDAVPAASGETVLSLSRAAVALLAQAVDGLGDELAIAGFHSNTRHEVRYWHIKGFAERWSDPAPQARLAGTQGACSTRLGAALRHAGELLSGRTAEQRLLLVLTDGVPSDVDVSDPEHLLADAAHAVRDLAGRGLPTHCVSLDPQADNYVRRIFGKRFSVIDRVQQLPQRLPEIFIALTR